MADSTYTTAKVYHKQGGSSADFEIVADGGEISVESGGTIVVETGGKIEVESGGELEIQSSGAIDFQDGASFTLVSTALAARKWELQLLSDQTITDTWAESGTGLNAATVDPPYGFHLFSAPTGMSLGSATLLLPSAGATLYLNGDKLVGDANVSLDVITGATLLKAGSIALSGAEISAAGWMTIKCVTDSVWYVVEGNYTEHLAA